MVNKEIFKIADQLQKVADQQKQVAKQSLEGLPNGATKDNLQDLLRRASSGKLSPEAAQKEIQKIMDNAC